MFARIKKNSGTQRCSVIICHNHRIDGKVRQFTLKVFGHSSDPSQLAQWFEEANDWVESHRQAWAKPAIKTDKQFKMNGPVNLYNMREKTRINVGIGDVFGQLYEALGFDTLLSSRHQETLRQVIYARLLEPSSKLRASEIAEHYFGEVVPVDRMYRMMDKLIEISPTVERKIFDSTQRVTGTGLSLVLFDVTTLSFETIGEDALRAFGYSKDFKFNTTQVVLALATTKEGLPVGYRLFAGNTAESSTLIESIHAWRRHIPIEAVTVVGDRAMMSEANLTALEAAGFHYVVAFPLRKLSKKEQIPILDKAGYTQREAEDEVSRYRIIEKGQRRLVVTYSAKRAEKDKKDRDRLIKRLEKKLKTCKNVKRLVNNKGYLKYTEIAGQASAHINEEKIANDAQWDGLHGVITNKPVNTCDVYQDYHRLWVIEESFRINKHNLKMRPIYHFTPKRIQAHILLCYMVFALVRHLQFQLAKGEHSMSVRRIIEAVRNVQASILQDTTNDKHYRMLSSLSQDAKAIYEVMGIKQGLDLVKLE